tara:strand:+ start:115 stop:1065 length:951 start_codon:yes stop_codon:yes gene_type:complete
MKIIEEKINSENLKDLTKKNNLKGFVYFFCFFSIIFSLFLIQIYFLDQKSWLLFILTTYFLGMFLSFVDQTAVSHQFQHNNVFTSKKLNQSLYKICMFYSLTNWVYNKSSHIAHHKYTLDENIDDEFANEKLNLLSLFQLFTFNLIIFYRRIKVLIFNCFEIFPKSKLNLRSNSDFKKKISNCARFIVFFHIILFSFFYYFDYHYYYLIFILSQFVFNFLKDILLRTQHYKLKHNSTNVLENTRSIETNFFIKFLFLNENYHIEHHLYPSVPFYNLPKLRKIIGSDNIPTIYGFGTFIKILFSDNLENVFFLRNRN